MNRSAAEAQENREKILKYIAGYIKAHCYPPAIYEIAKETGLSKTDSPPAYENDDRGSHP